LLSAFPFLIPFCLPSTSFYLLGNPPCCDRIPSNLCPRLLVNWFPRLHPLPIPSLFQNPDRLGFSWAQWALAKTTSQNWLTSPEQFRSPPYFQPNYSGHLRRFKQIIQVTSIGSTKPLRSLPSPEWNYSVHYFFSTKKLFEIFFKWTSIIK
jgi:hypothetical protein